MALRLWRHSLKWGSRTRDPGPGAPGLGTQGAGSAAPGPRTQDPGIKASKPGTLGL